MPADDDSNEVDVDELFSKLSLETDDVNSLTAKLQSDAGLIDKIDRRGQSLLHLACLKNATKSVLVLIKAGANVNQANRDGERPIVLAFGNNNVDMIQHLIAAGANIALDGHQLLLWVTRSNQPNLIQMLLNNKVDVNFKDVDNDDGKTALHIAVDSVAIESVKLLIDKGANVNACDNNNNTALHLICMAAAAVTGNIKNQEAIIALLLSKAANINAVNSDNRTPIFLAILNNQLSIVQLLLSKSARIDVSDCYNKNLLHIALNNSYIDIALHLINHTTININAVDDDGDRPLDIACMNQLVELVALLLTKGANPNAVDNNTSSSTTAATSTLTTTANTAMTKSVLLKVCEVGNLKILQLLLQAGANPNYIDASGNSPLHELFTKKHIDCIRYFVLYKHSDESNNRASTANAASKARNMSPVKTSSAASNNNTNNNKIVNMNIDLNIKDGNERTILSKLCKWDNLEEIQLLFELSDKLQQQLSQQPNNLTSFLKLNTEICDVYGNTPLHYVAEMHNENRVEIAKLLLYQYGANVNAMNYYGDTVLIKACEQSDIEIATMLVESGADINFQGNEGHTALHKACLKHAGDVIELLIRYGADTHTLKDKEGRGVVDCCGENDAMKNYIQVLLQAYTTVADT